ncbi:hypothetical protein K461DRAFT_278283 [Myriangium duriaei CBS 260.36]|uniref:Uncharacterized protein n=1 Tax=Myriangium duriaei CBS 260.36 TaxID=1168546 RepID=A0A9P4J5B5_9PEZI|nr:hypothetical protein K461DRAFT_278283 [Myriangium duriaei CBS 260.36]
MPSYLTNYVADPTSTWTDPVHDAGVEILTVQYTITAGLEKLAAATASVGDASTHATSASGSSAGSSPSSASKTGSSSGATRSSGAASGMHSVSTSSLALFGLIATYVLS